MSCEWGRRLSSTTRVFRLGRNDTASAVTALSQICSVSNVDDVNVGTFKSYLEIQNMTY